MYIWKICWAFDTYQKYPTSMNMFTKIASIAGVLIVALITPTLLRDPRGPGNPGNPGGPSDPREVHPKPVEQKDDDLFI